MLAAISGQMLVYAPAPRSTLDNLMFSVESHWPSDQKDYGSCQQLRACRQRQLHNTSVRSISKDQLQRKLYIPVGSGSRRNHAECRRIERSSGKTKVWVIQTVEQFGSELEHRRPFGEPEIFESRKVPIAQPRTYPRVPAYVAK